MEKPTLSFKSNLPSLTLLKINTQNLNDLQSEVRKKIRQAPMMFIGMQVVIDVSDWDKEDSLSLDLAAFKDFLMGESIHPVAIMSNSVKSQQLAINTGLGALPVLTSTTTAVKKQSVPEKQTITKTQDPTTVLSEPPQSEEPKKTFDDNSSAKQEQSPQPSRKSRTVRHSIRSGQSIYTQGDLTIVGSVSPGAEVIADGNIHIYGTLRGRAIAGAQGDETANIFCQRLDAELVAIAGNYKQMEGINRDYQGKTVIISLESEQICFFTL